ncbi:efflux RND transporter periplasmic adaptor subunit [Flavobacteriaceae bacterium F89]|uniref:Efflux RND transporter periplasmic adaptor subunit n=1 Tax=Cerina litoralis TaxID=2874477 RepID=A0AAE3ES89_9FLAO|nr:efflux RND transporter periplasmic adaptor subunit [Cerina litoralis]MCG2459189.1 efflux RND transporter periplasmic adaptor subunit [Cerina litoralis]
MKKIVTILTMVIFLMACGSKSAQSVHDVIASGNLKEIRATKTAISEKHKLLEQQIKLLDSAIGALDSDEKFPLVSTLEVKSQTFNHFLDLQGGVKTKQNVLIYPEMAGTLLKVYVKEGQKVAQGQLLATIDDGGMASQVAQMKTQAALAKTTFERQQRLWDQKIGSEIQYLQAKSSYEAQESTVKQMESQLEKMNIRAPFSGIIDDVIKDQGTVVSPGPGSEIFRIVNLSNMYIEVEVPENYLGSVTKGKEVRVYFPVLSDSITTQIRETGNFINPNNRSFKVEIPVPNSNGKIKPNLTAKVQINDYTKENAIMIPQSIISENAEGEQYAFVAKDPNSKNEAIAQKVIITTGKTQGPDVEILSGIQDGDQVIKEGARSVKDGQKIKILNQLAVGTR